jgi:hypothetical protein
MNNKNSLRCVLRAAALCAMSLALLASHCPRTPVTVQENLVLAYVTAQDRINARWAPANAITSWSDGAFPSTPQAGRGVGMAIDNAGVMHIALTDSYTEVKMVWGLGPAVWDNSASSEPSAPPNSSPVGVYLAQNRWAISFLRADDTVFIGIYDHGTRQFVSNVAPSGQLSTHLGGRPSLAVLGNTVIAAWRRWNGTSFDLVIAPGEIQQGNLAFARPRLIDTPAGSGLRGGVDGDPVVARAGANFFLAVVREQQGEGAETLHGWRTQLFTSADAVAWSSAGIIGCLEVDNQTYLGLGGASNGELLAAALRRLPTGTASVSVAHFANGQWQPFSSEQVTAMFNRPAVWKPFVVVGSKP